MASRKKKGIADAMASLQSSDIPKGVVALVTRKDAARGQLDSSIELWFEEGDVAPIHTLAVATQGILSSICKDMDVPLSPVVALINSKSKTERARLRGPQNFFKHGRYTEQVYDDLIPYLPIQAEMFTIDNIQTYQRLFDILTPLMFLYALRFSVQHPRGLPYAAFDFSDAKFAEKLKVENLSGLSRKAFFDKVFSLIKSVKIIGPPGWDRKLAG